MPPEDFVPELPYERYLNEAVISISFDAADSTTIEEVVFDTGMAAEAGPRGDEAELHGQKWVVYGAFLHPYGNTPPHFAANNGIWVQLQKGDQTGEGMFPLDDERVIADGVLGIQISGVAGAAAIKWPIPLDVKFPRPVFNPYLSVKMRSEVDDAAIQDDEMFVSVVYGWADAWANDIWAALQASHR
jgi:hypothetical protein